MTRNIYAPANYPTHYGDVTSIVTPQWHLIAARNRPPELYRWGDDPAEISNLAGSPAVHDVLMQLNSLLRDRLASSALAQMAKEHTVPSR